MSLVAFDLETTGLSPRWHDIIQIAAARIRTDAGAPEENSGETFSTYVRPRRPVPAHITGLTGITDDDVAGAPGVPEALRAFARFINTVGGRDEITLVAHNGHRFDMRFIAGVCARHALPVRPVRFIDSLWLSKKLWPAEPLHNLDAIIERLGLASGELVHPRHDARADVRLLATAVGRMIRRLRPDGVAGLSLIEPCRRDFVAA